MAAHVRWVCSRRRIPSELYIGADGAGVCVCVCVWNRCQDVRVTPRHTTGGFQYKGFGKCVPADPAV